MNFIILIHILIYLIGNYLYPLKQYDFYIGQANFTNILFSLFLNKDLPHLYVNMITFYLYSRNLYDGSNNSKSFIKSWKFFLFLYLISGIFGYYFEILIFDILNNQQRQYT